MKLDPAASGLLVPAKRPYDLGPVLCPATGLLRELFKEPPPARPSYLASAGSSGPLEQVSCRRKTASQKQVCRFPRPFSPRTLSIQRVETHRPIKDPSPTRTARSSKRHSPGPARDPAKASDASPLPPDIIGVSQRANQTRWGPGPPPVHDDARDLGLICQT